MSNLCTLTDCSRQGSCPVAPPSKNTGGYHFSKASSLSRVEPWVSCITGRFFSVWVPGCLLILFLSLLSEQRATPLKSGWQYTCPIYILYWIVSSSPPVFGVTGIASSASSLLSSASSRQNLYIYNHWKLVPTLFWSLSFPFLARLSIFLIFSFRYGLKKILDFIRI